MAETRGNTLFGVIAILTGLSFLVHLGVVVALPSPNSYQELAVYKTHQTVYALLFFSIVIFTAFAVTFLAGLGRLLAPRSSKVAAGATMALATGILVTGLGVVLSIGALAALAALPSDPSYEISAAFEGAFWADLQSLTNVFGDALMGLGLILLGWVAWGSRIVPNWLAIIAVVGGIGAFAAIVADPLAAISFLAFTIWSVVVGVIILRKPRGANVTAGPSGSPGSSGP
ncbi:MAG TPA: DUF4386 family protein [Candidatus Acidoferrum sp.]|jgi:hypothetical protein|nr:DUF4386 family protein [Candidatus Acidoferrum sp.]